jgi:hypothetical protein
MRVDHINEISVVLTYCLPFTRSAYPISQIRMPVLLARARNA